LQQRTKRTSRDKAYQLWLCERKAKLWGYLVRE